MFKHVLRQFYLSKAERYGATALMLLAVAVFIMPEIYRLLHKPEETDFLPFSHQVEAYFSAMGKENNATAELAETPTLFDFDPNTASVEIFRNLGLSQKIAGTIVKYRERGGRFHSADDLQKIYTLPEEDFERLRPYIRIGGGTDKKRQGRLALTVSQETSQTFSFDPNTAQEQDFLRLGLPGALVTRLLKYREKGGFFFDKSDFKKLYGLSEADFTRLEPYIAIARSEASVRPAAYSGGGGWARSELAGPLDINGAAPDDWRQLPGIGAARAHKIVRYRDKLGGFTTVDQVAETFDLPDSVFQKIRTRLQIQAPVYRQINLNTVTAEDLDAHPYFSLKQAQLIIAYRTQHGPFVKVEDIERIAAFTDKQWLGKVKPYLKIGE